MRLRSLSVALGYRFQYCSKDYTSVFHERVLCHRIPSLLNSFQRPFTSTMPEIDVLKATAEDLYGLLQDGKLTSESLVEEYLDQIARHNHDGLKVGAVCTTAPREKVLEIARQLDQERREKGPRSPLHGIPVLVKDVFLTPSLDMPTTFGSVAFKTAKASKDADVISLLLKAGAIIIGKANLSELGAFKGAGLPTGWSAFGGYVQSPYVRGGMLADALPLGHSTPAGSSSGPAAGLAAGFAALSVSTETDGSTVQPATRAAAYGLKMTLGSVPTNGSQPITPVFDCVGAMAKSPYDLAVLAGVLQGEDYRAFLTGSWEGLRVGFVDPALWQPASFIVEPREDFRKQSDDAFKAAVEKLKAGGAKVAEQVPLPTVGQIFENGVHGVDDTFPLMLGDFRGQFNEFLKGFDNFEIKTLEDLIKWNEEHSDKALPKEFPSQSVLVDAQKDEMSRDDFDAAVRHMRKHARDPITKALEEYGVDLIVGPADGRIASTAACAGYPVGTVPLGFAEFNGRAFGLNIIAPSDSEGNILAFMSAWERTFPNSREAPPLLVNWMSSEDGTAHL